MATPTQRLLTQRAEALEHAQRVLIENQKTLKGVERRELEAVTVLRSEGVAWREIARLMGVSHEAARRKYGHLGKWGDESV